MPVWVDGKTVRGYKAEQFADAFAQLGVRSVRDVRSESTSDAAPNAPNAPNANTRPGDPGYLDGLFTAFAAGHVTPGEWQQLSTAHQGTLA